METPKSHYADVRIVRPPRPARSAGGAALAAGPPALRAALHPHLLLLDQPGRAMAGRTAATLPRTRGVLLARRTHHRARRLDQALERTRPALQMDQDRRPDHRPDLPLLLTHLRTGTLVAVADPAGTRYRVLETIRQYGASRLADAGESVEALSRHLRWCLDAGARLPPPPGPDDAGACRPPVSRF